MSQTSINKNLATAPGGQNATITTGQVKAGLGCIGLEVFFDVTVVPGVDTVTCNVYARDSLSGKRVLILASTARAGVGTERLKIFPGLVAAANVAANDVIGDHYEIEVAHSAATVFNYTVSAKELCSA